MNSQIESAISSAVSERIIPQMQGVVVAIISRQLESVSPLSRRPQNMEGDEGSVDENNIQNRNFCSRQNVMEPEVESPYSLNFNDFILNIVLMITY